MSASKPNVSILIVYYAGELIFETLKAIYAAKNDCTFEVIVADNNAKLGVEARIKKDFPDVIYSDNQKNLGFARGMNAAYKHAKGDYLLVFNPDIELRDGALDELLNFLRQNKDVGVVGPRLENTDGSLQYSCYRLPKWTTPLIARTPLKSTVRGRHSLARYYMEDVDHTKVMDVDSLMGAAQLVRREAWESIEGFDGRYALYYEDNDFNRMLWKAGWRVVYYPKASMMHHHRRLTADGSLFAQLRSRMTWVQIASFIKYKLKFLGQKNPKDHYHQSHV